MWNFTGRLLLLLAVGLANGCVGYRVGTVNPTIPADHSIQVGLFQNGTAQPGLSESVNASIRRELHRDGTFELATANDGDVLLTGTSRLIADPQSASSPETSSPFAISSLNFPPELRPRKKLPAKCWSIAWSPAGPPSDWGMTWPAPSGRRCLCWPTTWPSAPWRCCPRAAGKLRLAKRDFLPSACSSCSRPARAAGRDWGV